MFYFAVMFIALFFLLLWRWDTDRGHRNRADCRRQADERLASYRSRSERPSHDFFGNEATVVLRKEEFVCREGQQAGKFVYLCRNRFDEYFFCVIDVSLSAIHIPRERALLFLKDFPNEYAAEIDYLRIEPS